MKKWEITVREENPEHNRNTDHLYLCLVKNFKIAEQNFSGNPATRLGPSAS